MVHGYTTEAGEVSPSMIQRDIFDVMEIHSVHIRKVLMRYSRFSDRVVVIVELDAEAQARLVLQAWWKLKQRNSQFFVTAGRTFEERQRRREERFRGQRIPSGMRRDQDIGRSGEFSSEEIQKAVRVMQSLNTAGNGRWNQAAPIWGNERAAERNRRHYGNSQQ